MPLIRPDGPVMLDLAHKPYLKAIPNPKGAVIVANGQPPNVLVWEDDPGAPPSINKPIIRPRPNLGDKPLPVGIAGAAPAPGPDQLGSPEFRYWSAADALSRAATFWGPIVPAGTTWNANVGPTLIATLDGGDDLNAYYDRNGLTFFHHRGTDGKVYYSGESPDVVCHELGHAVLDAVRPQLWDVSSAEVGALHEAFGDISGMLSALQLESFRATVLAETMSYLSRSSRLSRLAEQLGYAIRQVAPQAVDRDCLRNASNRFFYRDPLTLPPSAPASSLSSEVHSFSRVFSGAYLLVIAGIFSQTGNDSAALLATSRTAGQLLISAVRTAPITAGYYSQVAANVIAADQALNGGRYANSLKQAFLRHGILSPQSAASMTSDVSAQHAESFAAFAEIGPGNDNLPDVQIDGALFGIAEPVTVAAPAEPPRFAVAGAALAAGSVEPSSAEAVANGFVEDLIRNGRVAVADQTSDEDVLRLATHEVSRDESGNFRLIRKLFD
jgi:hypothetical protein